MQLYRCDHVTLCHSVLDTESAAQSNRHIWHLPCQSFCHTNITNRTDIHTMHHTEERATWSHDHGCANWVSRYILMSNHHTRIKPHPCNTLSRGAYDMVAPTGTMFPLGCICYIAMLDGISVDI